MKSKTMLSKKDLVAVLLCALFLLANLAAIGAGGRRRAKDAICLSNLRKWAVVWEMFTDDNGGRFMSGNEIFQNLRFPDLQITCNASYQTGVCDHDHSWPVILWPYYRERRLLCCPTANSKPKGESRDNLPQGIFLTWGLWLDYSKDFIYGSYGVNCWIFDRSPKTLYGGVWPLWRHARQKTPELIPIMMDCAWAEGWPRHSDPPPATQYKPQTTMGDMGRFCVNRHNAAQGLFLDFSARKVGLKELWEIKWNRNWFKDRQGNPDYHPPTWPLWMRNFKDYSPYAK